MFQIESKMVTSNTADADDKAHGGGSDAEMGGLVTRQCSSDNHNGGIDAWACGRSRRHIISVKPEGFHVTGP